MLPVTFFVFSSYQILKLKKTKNVLEVYAGRYRMRARSSGMLLANQVQLVF